MNKTILLAGCFLLAFLALAGCAAATTPMPASPTPSAPPQDVVSCENEGFITVELGLPYAPRLSETVILTWTVTPYWSALCRAIPSTITTTMKTWIEMPPGSVVVEIPPGMTWIPVENVPWNCYGCIGVLQAREEVLHLSENRQYTVPIRFEAEGPEWGGATTIYAVAQMSGTWSYFLSDSDYLDLTITKDFSHFGVPEGWDDRPRLAVPGPDSPPTTDPALIPRAVVTPDLSDSPPVITPVPVTVEVP